MNNNLQNLRINAGYTSARKFAEACGFSYACYNNYEHRKCRIPLENAVKIADFLNCSLDDLVDRKSVCKSSNIQAQCQNQNHVCLMCKKLSQGDKMSVNKHILALSALLS